MSDTEQSPPPSTAADRETGPPGPPDPVMAVVIRIEEKIDTFLTIARNTFDLASSCLIRVEKLEHWQATVDARLLLLERGRETIVPPAMNAE